MEKINEILEVINKVRPYLLRDGGDVEFVKYEDGYVFVRMHGACTDCMGLDDTITFGLEALLFEEVDGIKGVRIVDEL